MKRAGLSLLLLLALSGVAFAQEDSAPTRPEKRSWFGRMLHPFRSEKTPEYKDASLRGLVLELQLSPQPIKLSEVRQMDVKVAVINKGKRPVTLEFPTTQRFEIFLLNTTDKILSTWSENHAFTDEPSTFLINPGERIEYAETIATRELSPNKVFICEVYFPKYSELRLRQKFLTAP